MNGLKSLDDFLLQGKATGKKWASGIAYSDYSSKISVSNLDFNPSYVFLYLANVDSNYSCDAMFLAKNIPAYYNGAINAIYKIGVTEYGTGPYGSSILTCQTIINNGFTVTTNYNGQKYNWIAIE